MDKKVCVITGGSSGIGRALAFEFGGKGYAIVITGRNQEQLYDTSKALSEKGIEVLAVSGDVSLRADSDKLFERTIARFSRADVLINNAGMSMRAAFSELDPDVIRKLVEINLLGTVYTTRAFINELIERKGSVIGISSIAGYRGLPGRTGYSASKFGMQGFLESLRTEVIEKGVHVLIACPGFTASNIRKTSLLADGSAQGQSPLDEGKNMSPEVVAKKIFNAVVKRKKILTLTTQGKLTVFMNKLFPSWMDGQVLKHFKKEKDSPFS